MTPRARLCCLGLSVAAGVGLGACGALLLSDVPAAAHALLSASVLLLIVAFDQACLLSDARQHRRAQVLAIEGCIDGLYDDWIRVEARQGLEELEAWRRSRQE